MPAVPQRQKLTESEGRVLALIARLEAPTTYTIFAVLEATPTASMQASKGAIYPIVERLKARALVAVTQVPNSGRGAETLAVTAAGMEAVREWVRDIRDEHILPYDPLRMRIPALQFLSPEERMEWLATAKQLNQRKADQVDAFQAEAETAFAEVEQSAAFSSLWGQSKWLDKLLIELIEGPAVPQVSRELRSL
jgi:DNA-binding PadR family transcriptional regulator